MIRAERGIGLDVVEIARIDRIIARSPSFAERYFTAAERRACDASPAPARAYAERFAVKEAVLKALGFGVLGPIPLCEIEVEPGAPTVVSMSAVATNVLEGPVRVVASVACDGTRAWASCVVEG